MTDDRLASLRTDLADRLLYRDGLMLIVDKPFGIPVHRGPKAADWKEGPALEQAFDVLTFGLPKAPSLAHRLDRDTSGCLVLGRHRKALETLFHLFREGKVGKTYWAVVEGRPNAEEGVIDLPLARLNPDRGWWMKVDPEGLPSQTRWRVLGHDGAGPDRAWLELSPITGRTHQLRVHCAAMGWPILGDPIYGTAPRTGGPGLHLHAQAVNVPLYPRKHAIVAHAPAPPHMRQTLARCGWLGEPTLDPTDFG